MPPRPEPEHLNNHHRATLREVFQHPASHNIEWHAVVSLLQAVGEVTERHEGKLAVRVGSQTAFLEPGGTKDLDLQAVADVRRLLTAAGYGSGLQAES